MSPDSMRRFCCDKTKAVVLSTYMAAYHTLEIAVLQTRRLCSDRRLCSVVGSKLEIGIAVPSVIWAAIVSISRI